MYIFILFMLWVKQFNLFRWAGHLGLLLCAGTAAPLEPVDRLKRSVPLDAFAPLHNATQGP